MAEITRERSKASGLSSNYVYIAAIAAILLVLAIFIYFIQRTGQAVKSSLQRQADAIAQVERSIQLNEKDMQLGEETNKILKEILEVLKSKG
jgi:Na+-transporting methylmalonyl-CoA/oxaloacetate decarboxylase gamma subunit